MNIYTVYVETNNLLLDTIPSTHTKTRKALKAAGVLDYANINPNDYGDLPVEHSSIISFETVLNKFVICERIKDFLYKLGILPGDAAQKMIDFDPDVFINVLSIPKLDISIPETICFYNFINFGAQQVLNNQWQGRESEKWARLKENEIVFKISRVPSPSLSLATCTDEETNEFFSLQGHKSLVFMKSKLKMRQLNTVKLGIESLGTNMKFKVKLSSTNEKKWISVDDKGAIYEDSKYIESFAHNENYIDRDSVIQFDAFKKNKRNVEVCFYHYKKGILISQSRTINLRFKQTSKKMKMVVMVVMDHPLWMDMGYISHKGNKYFSSNITKTC